jgi:hypothetical protein
LKCRDLGDGGVVFCVPIPISQVEAQQLTIRASCKSSSVYNAELTPGEQKRMNDNARLQSSTRMRLFAIAVALVCALGTGSVAHAQYLTTPTTPTLITPPAGNTAFAVGHAQGTQGYVCLPTAVDASTASWTVNGARPEATLFDKIFGIDVQIITHFLSPDTNPNTAAPDPIPFGSATWQSSLDSSKVWAAVLHKNTIGAGTDPSCPNTGSIACLLLESIGSQQGPAGGTFLSKTTFVQRLNTNGGSAPAEGCSTATDVGKQSLVPYTADYYFFRGTK